VIARYGLNNPLTWPEEVVKVGLVWIVFLGSYAAIVQKKEIKFDVLVHKFSPKTRLILGVIGEVLTVIFLLVVIYQGCLFTLNFAPYKMPMTGLSRAVVYIVFPFGGFLMCVHSLLSLVEKTSKLIDAQSVKQPQGGGLK
jgi:TRAP-type C4-dicarboxylate transport system permease small subunit